MSDEPLAGNYFVASYPPFSCWSEDGAESFRRALDRGPVHPEIPPLGLYVHIPFCLERCQYCYYLSHDDRPGEQGRYVDALIRELALYAETPAISGRKLSFVYFGGGTPSLLSAARIERLTGELQAIMPWTTAREVTFECAPKSVTAKKLGCLREVGVTRISLGVQQLDDEVLGQNGRLHLTRDVERAFQLMRDTGFAIVNLDLIVGLVGETDSSFYRSLDRIIEMAPESVTLYQLEIPHSTPLYRALRDGVQSPLPAAWPVKRARLREAFSRLEAAGYVLRSGYTAVRDPQRHRFVYQLEQYLGCDLLGIGASSFSYMSGRHHQNTAALESYIERLTQGQLPLGRGYSLGPEERLVREFVLQIKLGGVRREHFRRKFAVEVAERFAGPLQLFERKGWLVVEEDAVRLTREGLLRADRMIPAFYLPQHRVARYS